MQIPSILGRPTEQDDFDIEDTRTDEEIEAEAKKARIDFHRRSVRNGPAKFTYQTSGQQRRQAERDKKAFNRKVNKRHRRAWTKKRDALAVLRGHLQATGALAYADPDFTPSFAIRNASLERIVIEYGVRDEEGTFDLSTEGLTAAIRAAKEDYVSRLAS